MTIINASTLVIEKIVNEELEEDVSVALELRCLNDVDTMGIKPKRTQLSRQEDREQAVLDKATTWVDGRVVVGILWRGEFSSIPESEFAARRRLRLLHRKLSTTPGLFDRYAKTITDDIDKEYIRKLSQEEAAALCRRPHWFLPHFVVCHPDKPDRPR